MSHWLGDDSIKYTHQGAPGSEFWTGPRLVSPAASSVKKEPTVLWAQNLHFTGFRAPFSLFMVNIVEYNWQSTAGPVIGTN